MNKLLAEFFGTFWLVFAGCGSAVLAAGFNGEGSNLGIGFVGVSLAFGLTVLTMAYAVGHISGGHFNPAVTLGLVAGGRFQAKDAAGYIIAQVLRISGLSAIDKLAGFAVGSMKIFFVFSIFTVTLNNIEFIKERIEPYTQKSIMFPIFSEAGHYIVKLDTKQMLESAKEPFDTKNQ